MLLDAVSVPGEPMLLSSRVVCYQDWTDWKTEIFIFNTQTIKLI